MKILFGTDTWDPDVNGVKRTIEMLKHQLELKGHEVSVLHPRMFKHRSVPFYPSIKLAYPSFSKLRGGVTNHF